jgi:hypothetical protein
MTRDLWYFALLLVPIIGPVLYLSSEPHQRIGDEKDRPS